MSCRQVPYSIVQPVFGSFFTFWGCNGIQQNPQEGLPWGKACLGMGIRTCSRRKNNFPASRTTWHWTCLLRPGVPGSKTRKFLLNSLLWHAVQLEEWINKLKKDSRAVIYLHSKCFLIKNLERKIMPKKAVWSWTTYFASLSLSLLFTLLEFVWFIVPFGQ